jgi:hypothetical protein
MVWSGAMADINLECKTSFNIVIDSQNESIFCIGTLGASDVRLGKLQVTGDCGPLLLSNTIFTSWLQQSDFTLSVTCVDAASTPNSYKFDFDRCKVMQASAMAEATGTTVTQPFEFAALLPAPSLEITRAP